MGAGYKIKTTTYFDDVELTCVYDETDLSFVIMNNVKEDSDILDLVLAKAAADTKAFNAEYDVNMTKSVTFDDVLYIRAKMFDLTTYEQLKEIF